MIKNQKKKILHLNKCHPVLKMVLNSINLYSIFFYHIFVDDAKFRENSFNILTPREVYKGLDQYVIGQDKVKKTLVILFYFIINFLFLMNS